MKAIETFYKGYRFRSRLEARWAVFFDACGVKWEYEPEGFDLGDGLYYLPDFLLHDVYTCHGNTGDNLCHYSNLWVEVKGVLTEQDAKKILRFANVSDEEVFCSVENPILVVKNIPDGIHDLSYLSDWGKSEEMVEIFNFYTIDGDWYGAFPCIGYNLDNEKCLLIAGADGDYFKHVDEEATERAYDLARQARFEHGERGQ